MLSLTRGLPLNMTVVDRRANVVQANQHYADLVGRPPSAIIGHNLSEWLAAREYDKCRHLIDDVLTHERQATFIREFRRADGGMTIVAGDSMPLRSAADMYVVACSRIIYASATPPDGETADVADYILALAAELATMARRAGLSTLSLNLRELSATAAAVRRYLAECKDGS